MLEDKQIRDIAKEVATANLKSSVLSVRSRPSIDSDGREALAITIILKQGSASRIKGDAVLDTLVEIRGRLRVEGEDRFPIVEYATEKELRESGDT